MHDNEPTVLRAWPLCVETADGPRFAVIGSGGARYARDEQLEAAYMQAQQLTTLHGDCREVLPMLDAGSVQCVVTSPPYFGLRRYTDDPREIGQEPTPAAYVPTLVDADGLRHIIPHKDGDPLCGAERDGAQYPPTTYQRRALCPRCVQQHIRALRGIRLEDL